MLVLCARRALDQRLGIRHQITVNKKNTGLCLTVAVYALSRDFVISVGGCSVTVAPEIFCKRRKMSVVLLIT